MERPRSASESCIATRVAPTSTPALVFVGATQVAIGRWIDRDPHRSRASRLASLLHLRPRRFSWERRKSRSGDGTTAICIRVVHRDSRRSYIYACAGFRGSDASRDRAMERPRSASESCIATRVAPTSTPALVFVGATQVAIGRWIDRDPHRSRASRLASLLRALQIPQAGVVRVLRRQLRRFDRPGYRHLRIVPDQPALIFGKVEVGAFVLEVCHRADHAEPMCVARWNP
jgi:hypothetical protein